MKLKFRIEHLQGLIAGLVFASSAFFAMSLGNEEEFNITYLPVYKECKKQYAEFYDSHAPEINYRFVEFPQPLVKTRLMGVIELRSKVAPTEYLELYPSPSVVECLTNSYAEGSIVGSMNGLVLDIERAKELGSKNVYVEISENSYVIRFRTN